MLFSIEREVLYECNLKYLFKMQFQVFAELGSQTVGSVGLFRSIVLDSREAANEDASLCASSRFPVHFALDLVSSFDLLV